MKVKIDIYRDFLIKVNFSNGMYVCPRDDDRCYKYYVGFGNNSALIKGIMRRRFWWQITENLN